jgi:hypothetical protein
LGFCRDVVAVGRKPFGSADNCELRKIEHVPYDITARCVGDDEPAAWTKLHACRVRSGCVPLDGENVERSTLSGGCGGRRQGDDGGGRGADARVTSEEVAKARATGPRAPCPHPFPASGSRRVSVAGIPQYFRGRCSLRSRSPTSARATVGNRGDDWPSKRAARA